MIAKITQKNQLTLPKKAMERLGFSPHEEKYVAVEIQGNTVLLKPVVVTIEEKIPEEQLERFHQWALDHQEDLSFDSSEKASHFLRDRLKKK